MDNLIFLKRVVNLTNTYKHIANKNNMDNILYIIYKFNPKLLTTEKAIQNRSIPNFFKYMKELVENDKISYELGTEILTYIVKETININILVSEISKLCPWISRSDSVLISKYLGYDMITIEYCYQAECNKKVFKKHIQQLQENKLVKLRNKRDKKTIFLDKYKADIENIKIKLSKKYDEKAIIFFEQMTYLSLQLRMASAWNYKVDSKLCKKEIKVIQNKINQAFTNTPNELFYTKKTINSNVIIIKTNILNSNVFEHDDTNNLLRMQYFIISLDQLDYNKHNTILDFNFNINEEYFDPINNLLNSNVLNYVVNLSTAEWIESISSANSLFDYREKLNNIHLSSNVFNKNEIFNL